MSKEQNQKDVITTIGQLKEKVGEMQEEDVFEKLKAILNAKEQKVNIIYEDINMSMSFIVHPLTVAVQMEGDMFPTSIEKHRHLISRLVKTVDGRPLGYREVDIMPYGMQQELIEVIEDLSFSHQTERKKLDD